MKTKITKIGNSKGVIIPKEFLEQCNFKDWLDLELVENRIVLKPLSPRRNWESAFEAAGECETDELLLGDFPNSWDEEDWQW